MALREGDVITGAARYRLVERKGRGNFGEVWLAQETVGGEDVAEVAVKAFFGPLDMREVRALAALRHPHILPYRATVHQDGQDYLVTDYAAGGNAFDLIRAHPSGMPAEQVEPLILAVAEALAYLHGLGSVHRDVKPSNILLGEGTVWLGDAGTVKAVTTERGPTTGTGTVEYSAPERFRERSLPASDIYSLAWPRGPAAAPGRGAARRGGARGQRQPQRRGGHAAAGPAPAARSARGGGALLRGHRRGGVRHRWGLPPGPAAESGLGKRGHRGSGPGLSVQRRAGLLRGGRAAAAAPARLAGGPAGADQGARGPLLRREAPPDPGGGQRRPPFQAAGYDAVGLGCMRPEVGAPEHYHLPSDLPENLDPQSIVACVDFFEALVREIYLERL